MNKDGKYSVNRYLKFLCEIHVSSANHRPELRIEGKTNMNKVVFRSTSNGSRKYPVFKTGSPRGAMD